MWGVWNGFTALCIEFWSDHFILNADAMKLLVFPLQGTPHHYYPDKEVESHALQTNLEPSQNSLAGDWLWPAPNVKVLSC